ncbi:hypothetical protein ACJIZ3_024608 [Penstemon smallii]|uniref:Filament-like plant protein n=1 Tax=Penstemon smallii TaxID=265156 RepID=A0ABD3TSD3_9LAMI
MEKRKWLWKRKSSERSPGESESSGSFSSHSERYSDEQDAMRESPNDNNTQSPEFTPKATISDDEVKESVKCLTEKLSAALVNVSAKEDLVKQHAKVAEEAVAGWEKAENEVAALKQQLEVALQQNLNLEVRTSHLDGALKECVRQLRQARDEQEKRICDAILEKSSKWESTKAEFEKQVLELKAQVAAAKEENTLSVEPNTLVIIETLEKQNSSLKQQLVSRCNELEIMTIERDLSTKAAETASKQQLESIKKVAKLEAECRRLQSVARKSSPVYKQKSPLYAESLTDSHSECSDSWASALIAELDQFKNEKPGSKNLTVEIDMMDDFLEMERLAALPEAKSNTQVAECESASAESVCMDSTLKVEFESMIQRVAELEKKLESIEAEKLELEKSLDESQRSIKEAESGMHEAGIKLVELQKELNAVNEAKELLESQLIGMEVESRTLSSSVESFKAEIEKERTISAELRVKCQELENELTRKIQEAEVRENEAKELLESQLIGMEVESRTMSANIDSLKSELEKERTLSAELRIKCQELENELTRTIQETELHANANGELKLKQEDLAVAADKLAECQKTIASLGKQLQSLATLEDFLIDTSNIPGFSRGPLASGDIRKCESDPSRLSRENGSNEESPVDHVTSAKSRNGFGRFFSRSKSVVELGHHQD